MCVQINRRLRLTVGSIEFEVIGGGVSVMRQRFRALLGMPGQQLMALALVALMAVGEVRAQEATTSLVSVCVDLCLHCSNRAISCE